MCGKERLPFQCTKQSASVGLPRRICIYALRSTFPPMTDRRVSLVLSLARERIRQSRPYAIRSPDFRRKNDLVCYKATTDSHNLESPAISHHCPSYRSQDSKGSCSDHILPPPTWQKTSLAQRWMIQMRTSCTGTIHLRLPRLFSLYCSVSQQLFTCFSSSRSEHGTSYHW